MRGSSRLYSETVSKTSEIRGSSGSLLDQGSCRVGPVARVPGELEAVMTKAIACPPAPGPLEGYAARFDDLFPHCAQRPGLPEALPALPAPPCAHTPTT